MAILLYRSSLQRSGCTLDTGHESSLLFFMQNIHWSDRDLHSKLKTDTRGCNSTAVGETEAQSQPFQKTTSLFSARFIHLHFFFLFCLNFMVYTFASSEFTPIIRYLGWCRHSAPLLPAAPGQGSFRGNRNR